MRSPRTTIAPSPHAVGAAQLVAWGATTYAIPPLMPHIARDVGISVTSLSLALSLGLLASAASSLVVGPWIRRRGARAPMVLGTLVGTAALVGLATSGTAAEALLWMGVLAATGAALLYDPAFASLATRARDSADLVRAIQIVAFWGGGAALWAIPASTLVAERWGWRVASLVMAASLLAGTLGTHLGLPALSAASPSPASPRVVVPRRLVLGFALGTCVTGAVVVHGMAVLSRRQVPVVTAGVAFALLSPVQIVARAWWLRRRGDLTLRHGFAPLGLVAGGLLATFGTPNGLGLAGFVVLFGAGAGLMTTARAALVATLAPRGEAAGALASTGLTLPLARAAGPTVGASLLSGLGHEGAILALAALAISAAVLIASIGLGRSPTLARAPALPPTPAPAWVRGGAAEPRMK